MPPEIFPCVQPPLSVTCSTAELMAATNKSCKSSSISGSSRISQVRVMVIDFTLMSGNGDGDCAAACRNFDVLMFQCLLGQRHFFLHSLNLRHHRIGIADSGFVFLGLPRNERRLDIVFSFVNVGRIVNLTYCFVHLPVPHSYVIIPSTKR